MKRHNYFSWFACLFGLSIFAHAQAVPTATGGHGSLQVGINGSYIQPDYGQQSAKGVGVYGTFDFTQHIGVEGDVHISVITPSDIAESSYVFGPRYVFHKNRFHPYAKALFGLAKFTTQYDNRKNYSFNYRIYDFGGGLDIKATPKINIRAFDMEYQTWPGFSPNNLSPYIISVGAAYNFR